MRVKALRIPQKILKDVKVVRRGCFRILVKFSDIKRYINAIYIIEVTKLAHSSAIVVAMTSGERIDLEGIVKFRIFLQSCGTS